MATNDCTFQHFFAEFWEEAERVAEKNTAEIFGDKETLPPDELELVFSTAFGKLSQKEKVKALRDHRANRAKKTIQGHGTWN